LRLTEAAFLAVCPFAEQDREFVGGKGWVEQADQLHRLRGVVDFLLIAALSPDL
jgi:hypothetical protein